MAAPTLAFESSIGDDEAWLASQESIEWADESDDGASDEAEEEDAGAPRRSSASAPEGVSAGGEKVVAAAQVCAYALDGEAWRPLAGGAWTTLYALRGAAGLRVAALDPASATRALAVAYALGDDFALALHDDEAPDAAPGTDASSFGELACGGGDDGAVLGIRFGDVAKARAFGAALAEAAAPRRGAAADGDGAAADGDGAAADGGGAAADGDGAAAEAPPAEAPPREGVRRQDTFEASRASLVDMGFDGDLVDQAYRALGGTGNAESLANWVVDHPEGLVGYDEAPAAPAEAVDATETSAPSVLFDAEAVDDVAWTLVEEAFHATVTAVATDASPLDDAGRFLRSAGAAAACARALLGGAGDAFWDAGAAAAAAAAVAAAEDCSGDGGDIARAAARGACAALQRAVEARAAPPDAASPAAEPRPLDSPRAPALDAPRTPALDSPRTPASPASPVARAAAAVTETGAVRIALETLDEDCDPFGLPEVERRDDEMDGTEETKFGERQGGTRERNSQLQRLISRPFSTRFG